MLDNGVVHVGSHKGEEVSGYIELGRSPIICFEPQPLQWTPRSGVTLSRYALSDNSSRLTMRLPHHLHETIERDTQSASGLKLIPSRARSIGWTPTACDFIYARAIRFDEWADLTGFSCGSCSLLVVDVQGMELQVLSGFGEYLSGFRELSVECSESPLYEGGAKAQHVVDFLAQKGFNQLSPILPHGDIKFSKEIHAC